MADLQFGENGWTLDRIKSLVGKTFVITGATSGTGYEATRILAKKGGKVIMLNRNMEKSEKVLEKLREELGNIKVSYIVMDLSNQSSVKEAAKEINLKVNHIDALICNAAIAQVPTQKITIDGYESMLGVNHYGHFTLQALLFPLINKSKGRIVTVGSMGYDMGIKTIQFDDMNWDHNYNQNSTYSQSKLAQIMMVYELQDRLKKANNKNVKVYACHPGSSATSLIKTSGNLITRIMFGLMKLSPMVQSAQKGAYPEIMCATENNLDESGFYGPTGRSFWVGPVGNCGIKPHALDKNVARKLWEVSTEATGVSFDI